MRGLYRYPQRAYPYEQLVTENARRGRDLPEYELRDTGAFDENRFFDVQVEYGKADPEDVSIRLTVTNRGPEAAPIHLLPTLWSRNTWDWGREAYRPRLYPAPAIAGALATGGAPAAADGPLPAVAISIDDTRLGNRVLVAQGMPEGPPVLLFTDNVTNAARLWDRADSPQYPKDAFHARVVGGREDAVNPALEGTKAAVWYRFVLAPGETRQIRLRLRPAPEAAGTGDPPVADDPLADVDRLIERRISEADEFYLPLGGPQMTAEERLVQRQAFAGLLWCKQIYHYSVAHWLDGDPASQEPPASRLTGRNSEWRDLVQRDVLSMPDSWEYPWYAAWDLAFHCLPLAQIDPAFAKGQLLTLTQVWYQHPNGQLPAYEWNFSDVNPPVHAWAAWRVYEIDARVRGEPDRMFLERVFLKLLLNFTWWVNRKDADGRNVFQGGFLGLDNIGVFDRSKPLPVAGRLAQADGTAWMGMYCLSMLKIATELARDDRVYEDLAVKFFEHFLQIAAALNDIGGLGIPLWNDDDEFFYDVLRFEWGDVMPLKVRSVVGLIPLLAVETIEPDLLERLPEFRKRMEWFLKNRPDMAGLVSRWEEPGMGERRLLALVRGHRMKALLARMLDPNEFLSDHGIRSMSRQHSEQPYELNVDGQSWTVDYEPAESRTGAFGGNSNWRGPVWFPINYLLIEALQRFAHYYGPDFRVQYPAGSGQLRSLAEVAHDLSLRLESIFLPGPDSVRPFLRADPRAADPLWRDLVQFHEYFDGETGAGLGASHQTGWTGLVAKLLEQTTGGGRSVMGRDGLD
jgi:hypothetical protein